MTTDLDDTNDGDGATTEPMAREALSVTFTDEHDQRLAVGGPNADAFGGSDASDHSWGLGGGDRLGGGAEDDVLDGGEEARRLARKSPRTGRARSLNEIGAELAVLGYTTAKGKQFSAEQVRRLVQRG